MATLPSQGKLLYHITHIDNMPSILLNGLLPRKVLLESGMRIKDIADPEILSKRESYKEALSQFVLFHFFARNPFDGAVCKKYGADNMVIITTSRALHDKKGFIIPSHPLDVDAPEIFSYEEGLKMIKWDILDRTEGRDYHDPEIRKACMAECVMNYSVPVEDFKYIFVKSIETEKRILQMRNSDKIQIKVNPLMFPNF